MNTTTEALREDARKDPDVLKREADVARANVNETLDALQQRLSPGQLLDQTMALVQRHGGEVARNLGQSVKQNPLPMMLAGIGIAWLMIASRSSRTQSYPTPEPYPLTGEPPLGEFAGDEASGPGVADKLRGTASAVRDRVSGATHRVGDAASSLSESARNVGTQARVQSQRAREGFTRMMDEQPLLLGIFGIAIGAAIGASLPPTRREDEMLGEVRDRALQSASESVSQQLDRVRDTVRQGGGQSQTGSAWPGNGEGIPPQH